MTFSHAGSENDDLLRPGLLMLDRRNRIQFGISQFRFSASRHHGWATRELGMNEFRTTYERLAGCGPTEFIRIARFLGWPVSDAGSPSQIAW